MNITIVTPVYNDWQSFNKLLDEFKKVPVLVANNTRVIAVNDNSTQSRELTQDSTTGSYITIINLLINVGHQRAICIGLSYLHAHMDNTDVIIVMDSDGEDKPSDITHLVEAIQKTDSRKIVFARRRRRKEGFFFRMFYIVYKFLFKLLTGHIITFGNFSSIPYAILAKIISNPLVWNHYSGSILKSKIPYTTVPLDRGKRLYGKSKMNFIALFLHGLSSISIYNEILAIRVVIASVVGILITITGSATVITIKLFTDLAIPGWASSIVLLIMIITIQLIIVGLTTVLLTLNSRSNHQASPRSFYQEYIESVEEVRL